MTTPPAKRSACSSMRRRIPHPWEPGRPFRILSIDGGGIRGIFSASVLAHYERKFLNGASAAGCFDLVVGTSTGGIIALGLAAGMTATELAELYIQRGGEIFPPPPPYLRTAIRFWHGLRRLVKYRYDRVALEAMLRQKLGDRRIRDASVPLCVPAFEGYHGEVNIYKTPHHLDYHLDGVKTMVQVALATSAAPTYFQPLSDRGHFLVDGGIWANNPVMIGLVDALTCFDLNRADVHILSLGCGDEPYRFSTSKISSGGLLAWRDLFLTGMRLQSQNALGQARLLIGSEQLLRIDCPEINTPIALDDWLAARKHLPAMAVEAASEWEPRAAQFFTAPARDWRMRRTREIAHGTYAAAGDALQTEIANAY